MKFKISLILLMFSASAFGLGVFEGAFNTAANVAADTAYVADSAVDYGPEYGPVYDEPYYNGGYPYAQAGPFVF